MRGLRKQQKCDKMNMHITYHYHYHSADPNLRGEFDLAIDTTAETRSTGRGHARPVAALDRGARRVVRVRAAAHNPRVAGAVARAAGTRVTVAASRAAAATEVAATAAAAAAVAHTLRRAAATAKAERTRV